jgi:putative transcriptional regulator
MRDIKDILKIKTNNLAPEKGRLLISEPFLLDYFFKRSVVLLADHNEEGSFGVIINKPVQASFNEVVKDFPDFDAQIYLGGPVQGDSLFFIHKLGDKIPESAEILKGLYWGGDIETVREMITLKILDPGDIRFFVGYSGWAPQQLDDELKRNSWVVSKTSSLQVFNISPDKMWPRYLKKLGGDYAYWTKLPDDPTNN